MKKKYILLLATRCHLQFDRNRIPLFTLFTMQILQKRQNREKKTVNYRYTFMVSSGCLATNNKIAPYAKHYEILHCITDYHVTINVLTERMNLVCEFINLTNLVFYKQTQRSHLLIICICTRLVMRYGQLNDTCPAGIAPLMTKFSWFF